MQTTAIGTVANSLPENEVILLTILISDGYIPYTELRNKSQPRPKQITELCAFFTCGGGKVAGDCSGDRSSGVAGVQTILQ